MPEHLKTLKAGRPKNTGKFGAVTKPVRIPIDRIEAVYQFLAEEQESLLPLFISKVPAGFPSPADDYVESQIDLNKHLVKKPAATFLVKVTGDSMIKVGIFPGDTLIVDRSIKAVHGKIVIAILNGELTVKRLYQKNGMIKLMPENDAYAPIEVQGELEIWGVVRHAIRSFEPL